jgi:hypothetical protein
MSDQIKPTISRDISLGHLIIAFPLLFALFGAGVAWNHTQEQIAVETAARIAAEEHEIQERKHADELAASRMQAEHQEIRLRNEANTKQITDRLELIAAQTGRHDDVDEKMLSELQRLNHLFNQTFNLPPNSPHK